MPEGPQAAAMMSGQYHINSSGPATEADFSPAGQHPSRSTPSTSSSLYPAAPSSSLAPAAAGPSSSSPSNDNPNKKTKRVQNVSCDACRIRKVKCDRAPKIAEWRATNFHLPQARDLTYRPGTDLVWCSLCSEHGIKCTLTIKPPKKRVGKRLAELKAHQQHTGTGADWGGGLEDGEGHTSDEEELDQVVPSVSSYLAHGSIAHPSKRQRTASNVAAATDPRQACESLAFRAGMRDAYSQHTSLLAPEVGLYGVPRLTKPVLDACFLGFFAGPCTCPSIIKYEEILPRYRAVFRKQSAPPIFNMGQAWYLSTPPAGPSSSSSANAAPNEYMDDGLPPAPAEASFFGDVSRRIPHLNGGIVPLPDVLMLAIALAGSGQLDKELFPYKLTLQRDLGYHYKRVSKECLHTVDLGMDFYENGAEARIEAHEAQDLLDAMLIVSAQDYEAMVDDHELALKRFRLMGGTAASANKALIRYQYNNIYNVRETSMEGIIRLAYKMGINRNPLHNGNLFPNSDTPPQPSEIMSLVARIRRTREWWTIFSSDAFESLARRTPLMIGDHDFDVPLPSFRVSPDGQEKVLSGFGPVEAEQTPTTHASDSPASNLSGNGRSAPHKRKAALSSFDINWMNTLFSLTFLARGMCRRFVSVRAQGLGVNVLDALNSIEVLERFYRGIPDELRWEHQDRQLLNILAELYPPETAARAAAARQEAGSSSSSGDNDPRLLYVRRRRVPNSLRATSRAFRDGIQCLFMESLLASVAMCVAGAVKDFGFQKPSRSESPPDPLIIVEAMLSGQLRENPFFRVNPDSVKQEPRFLQTLHEEGTHSGSDAANGSGKGQSRGGGGGSRHTDPLTDAAFATQQQSVEDVTVARLYTLLLRLLFRTAKIFKEGADYGFLSARHNTFAGVGATFALWGIQHVNDLLKAERLRRNGGAEAPPSSGVDGGIQMGGMKRRGLKEYPNVSAVAAADTGTNIDDAKQAVRDLIEALATTMDCDTRGEPLVRALRQQTQAWDEAEVRGLLQRHSQQKDSAPGNVDGSSHPNSASDNRPALTSPSITANAWWRLAGLSDAAAASTDPAMQPAPSHESQQPSHQRQEPNPFSPQQQQQQPPAHPPSGSVYLGLDPFADLSQFMPTFVPQSDTHAAGPNGPVGSAGSNAGTGFTGTSGYGSVQLPPIGHLAGGTNTDFGQTVELFDRAVQSMLAAAAAVPDHGFGGATAPNPSQGFPGQNPMAASYGQTAPPTQQQTPGTGTPGLSSNQQAFQSSFDWIANLTRGGF